MCIFMSPPPDFEQRLGNLYQTWENKRNSSHFRYYFVIASVAKQSHEIATATS